MAISLICLCGNRISARPDQVGQKVACFDCGNLIRVPVPGEASPVLALTESESAPEEIPFVLELAEPHDLGNAQVRPAPSEIPALDAVAPVEEIPVVIPIDDAEDEIPEVDVEEHQSPWDKKEPAADAKARNQDGVAADAKKPPSEFERNAAAAGTSSWATIGAIRLVEPAECIAYGPGGVLALAGQDDEVLVLNMKKGKKLDRFGAHDDVVTCVAVSATGDHALSGDRLGDVCYWDVVKCKPMRRMRVHESHISALAFSPDGYYAASGDRDGTISLWKLSSSKPHALDDAEWDERIASVSFSADSNLLSAAGERGHVAVWSAKTRSCVQRFSLRTKAIVAVRFSSRPGVLLAAASPPDAKAAGHPTVWRLDVNSGKATECFFPSDMPTVIPQAILLDQGAKRLLVAGKLATDLGHGSNCLQIWDLAAARLLYAFHDVKHTVASLAVTPGGTRVAAALTNGELQVFALPQHEASSLPETPTHEQEGRRRHTD